jgi:hypothetical protein
MSYDTAGVIINEVAAAVGLTPVVSPYSSADPNFIQLKYLLNVAGMELNELHDFQIQRRESSFTTSAVSTTYALPADFSRMIDQTHWDRAQYLPADGPLSPQDWQYNIGSVNITATLYVSFRITQGLIYVFPIPNPDAHTVYYEYISNAWVEDSTAANTFIRRPVTDDDIVMFEPILIETYLRVKFLEAKGFNSARARQDLQLMFDGRIGKDKGGKVLSLVSGGRSVPYLTGNSVADTGYGT